MPDISVGPCGRKYLKNLINCNAQWDRIIGENCSPAGPKIHQDARHSGHRPAAAADSGREATRSQGQGANGHPPVRVSPKIRRRGGEMDPFQTKFSQLHASGFHLDRQLPRKYNLKSTLSLSGIPHRNSATFILPNNYIKGGGGESAGRAGFPNLFTPHQRNHLR
jgi:hypothetical protein